MDPSVFGEICSWAQEDEVELSEEALVAIAINTKCAVVNITFMFSNKLEFIRRNNQQAESCLIEAIDCWKKYLVQCVNAMNSC